MRLLYFIFMYNRFLKRAYIIKPCCTVLDHYSRCYSDSDFVAELDEAGFYPPLLFAPGVHYGCDREDNSSLSVGDHKLYIQKQISAHEFVCELKESSSVESNDHNVRSEKA